LTDLLSGRDRAQTGTVEEAYRPAGRRERQV